MRMKKTADLTDEERASGKWLPFTPSGKVGPNGRRNARRARRLLRATPAPEGSDAEG